MDPLGFELLKDRYDFELERKERLTEALTLPVGVLTVLGGVIAFLAQSFSYIHQPLTVLFSVFLVLDVLSFAVCLALLASAYHAQTYVYLPTLAELHEAEGDLVEFYEANGFPPDAAKADFAASFEERIIEAADANTLSNDERARLLHRARIALFSVLVSTALALIPFVADRVRTDMPEQPKPTPVVRPSNAPAKPAFPQNRVIKEGANIPPRPTLKG